MNRQYRRALQVVAFASAIAASPLGSRAEIADHAFVPTRSSRSAIAFAAAAGQASSEADTRARIALRLGGAGNASGGFLAGLDLTVPSLRVGPTWTGRIDYDSWDELDLSGLFGGQTRNSHSYSFTVNQLTTGALRTRGGYGGFGLGYAQVNDVGRSSSGVALKLIGGVNLTGFLGVEANALFTEQNVVISGVARIRF